MVDRYPRPGPERAHPRVAIDAFVRVLGGEGEYAFRVRDLSRGGLFLYTRVGHLYPFHIGSQLQLELFDYDRAVVFRGLVTRVVEPGDPEGERFPAGFGVRIEEIDEANQARLDQLLARATAGVDPY